MTNITNITNTNPYYVQREGSDPTEEKVKKLLVVKAKEAEDIQEKPRKIIRTSSFHIPKKTKDEELKARSGEMWKCIDRIPQKGGGYIYKFELKEEFRKLDNASDVEAYKRDLKIEAKVHEIFPAIEPKDYLEVSDHIYSLKGFGFSEDNNFLYIPDEVALLNNIERFQEKDKDFPTLDILLDPGIATDSRFIESFITHHVLWSNGKEFLHDSIFHIAATLNSMKMGYLERKRKDVEDFKTERNKVIKEIIKVYRVLMIGKIVSEEGKAEADFLLEDDLLEKLFLALGYSVDLISVKGSFLNGNGGLEGLLKQIWDRPIPKLGNFFRRRFPKEGLVPSIYRSTKLSHRYYEDVWKDLNKMEQKFITIS